MHVSASIKSLDIFHTTFSYYCVLLDTFSLKKIPIGDCKSK
nr:MAG TPA: hypothetical protein [Caudoviricetes sp.]